MLIQNEYCDGKLFFFGVCVCVCVFDTVCMCVYVCVA